jgi:hypothetical protein
MPRLAFGSRVCGMWHVAMWIQQSIYDNPGPWYMTVNNSDFITQTQCPMSEDIRIVHYYFFAQTCWLSSRPVYRCLKVRTLRYGQSICPHGRNAILTCMSKRGLSELRRVRRSVLVV